VLFICSVIILLLVGAFGYLLSDYFNRDIHKLESLAEERVRNKLLERKSEILRLGNIGEKDCQINAKWLLTKIANILGVMDIELFRLDDKLCDILRVSYDELDEVPLRTWKKAGLGLDRTVQVHAYEIMELLNKTVDQHFSRKILQEVSCDETNTEEEIIEALFKLELKDFLRLLSPTLKRAP
jgi:hypothetical protein